MPFRFEPNWAFLLPVIDRVESLALLVSQVREADWIALDTEADSLHAYPEKLCLLQISIAGRDELVDPLAGVDLRPLLETFRKRELVLHGADYDLRMLYRTFSFNPDAIFDTMLAARFLGHLEFGLTHLVKGLLNIELEKGPQKMNWAQRPLTARMEAYARNDTRYLQPLAEILRARLEEVGRLSWHRETCARLIRECAQARSPDPDSVWRVKGSDRLDRRALAVLRELWFWREEEAVEANTPPYFVVSHELLVSLAEAAALGKPIEPLLSARSAGKRRSRLLDTIKRGLRQSPSDFPDIRRASGHRLTHAEQVRFDSFRQRRDRWGRELQIDPTLIASRAMLVALARNCETVQPDLMDWQQSLLLRED